MPPKRRDILGAGAVLASFPLVSQTASAATGAASTVKERGECILDVVISHSEAFENSTSLGAGSSLSNNLDQPGAEQLSGVVTRANTAYDVDIEWLDSDGNIIQTESVISNVSGGTQSTFDVPSRSPYANLVISDAGSGSGSVDLVAHHR